MNLKYDQFHMFSCYKISAWHCFINSNFEGVKSSGINQKGLYSILNGLLEILRNYNHSSSLVPMIIFQQSFIHFVTINNNMTLNYHCSIAELPLPFHNIEPPMILTIMIIICNI